MATQTDSAEGVERRFVLAPNLAPNWGQTWRIFLLLSSVCMGIALVCAWFGLWPVIPFAGLEIIALGAGLYVSARRSLEREVIDVDGGVLRVQKGRGRAEHTWHMERTWTEVVLRRLPKRWGETQLVLRSRDLEVTIGAFLDAEERSSLARELKRCIGPMARCGDGPARQAASEAPPEAAMAAGFNKG